MPRPPPSSTLFPYTTLFRSHARAHRHRGQGVPDRRHERVALLPPPHPLPHQQLAVLDGAQQDRKSTRLNSSHLVISYAVFCLKKKKIIHSCAGPTPTLGPQT